MLAQVMANQVDLDVVLPPQAPTQLLGYRVDEDLVEFIDEAYRIVAIIGLPKMKARACSLSTKTHCQVTI